MFYYILTFEYIYNKRQNMATFKKSELNELVGGDVTSSGGDRNIVNNSEIETGPVDKQWVMTHIMKRVNQQQQIKFFGNYRQNIPWFAVYSFGGSRSGRGIRAENTNKIITKKKKKE
jgi:hypothetical protein